MMRKLFAVSFLLLATIFVAKSQEAVPTPAPVATPEPQQVDPNAADIIFNTEEHDFGTLEKGGNATCTFSFKNEGKSPLLISNAKASCGCTVPSWPKEPIAPGGSGAITVKYDSNRVGTFNKTVTVTSNAKKPSVMLRIKGTINAPPAPAPVEDINKVEPVQK